MQSARLPDYHSTPEGWPYVSPSGVARTLRQAAEAGFMDPTAIGWTFLATRPSPPTSASTTA